MHKPQTKEIKGKLVIFNKLKLKQNTQYQPINAPQKIIHTNLIIYLDINTT